MTDNQDEGGDPARFRDPGIAEALLRLGPEAAAAHPGVLTQCGGTWVHHVCDGAKVEVREVSGAELEVLQARIRDFRTAWSRCWPWPGSPEMREAGTR